MGNRTSSSSNSTMLAKVSLLQRYGVKRCLEDDLIPVHELEQVTKLSNLIDRCGKTAERRPRLVGPHTTTLREKLVDNGVISYTGREREITIEGMPLNTDGSKRKQRHYWIYSYTPSWGKSHLANDLKALYDVAFIRDVNNWADVPDETQILLFDEVTRDNKIEWGKLKNIGSTEVGMNSKRSGPSKEVCHDAQLIVFSNNSPFEVYGKEDKDSGEIRMNQIDYACLLARFHIIKLGGSVESDISQYVALD